MKKLLLHAFVLLGANFLQAQVWEPVGNPNGVSSGPIGRMTLINDNQDNLYVGYYDVDVMSASVQKFDGTQWQYVGGQAITPDYVLFNSLSVDLLGTPYFFNQAAWPDRGHEARVFRNGVWEKLPNVTNNQINYNTSTFSAANILFASNNENGGTVKKFIDNQWIQVGNSNFAGEVPMYLDMVSGSDGKVYVSFNTGGQVRVYYNDQNATTSDNWMPVGGVNDLGSAADSEFYNSSLAIDRNNNVYIAYVSRGAGENKLNVKKFDGTSWKQLGQENFTQNAVQHTSIAVGANDIVYVAVSNWGNDNFLRNYVMAYDDATDSWSQAGTGFASEGEATYNSLGVDSKGNLFLAFADSGLDKLSVKKLNLEKVAAESIQINTENDLPAEINVDKGSLKLNASVFPAEASQKVVWTVVSGDTFATIDQNGVLSAITSNQTVTVRAHSAENSSIYTTIDVVLTNQDSDVDAESIKVTTADGGYPDINSIGGQLQLKATTSPREADQYVTWTVEGGNAIVEVDEEGLVTAKSEGSAWVKATHIDGSVSDRILVNVFANGCTQGHESMIFGYGVTATKGDSKAVDDFIVDHGVRFQPKKLRLSVISPINVDITSVDLTFSKDKGNRPGESIYSVKNIVPKSQEFVADWGFGLAQYTIDLSIDEEIFFNQGTYWLQPEITAADGGTVFWDATVYGNIGTSLFTDNFDGNGWVPHAGGGFNGVFDISGNCTPMPVVVDTLDGADTTIFVDDTLQLIAEVNSTVGQEVVWSIVDGTDFISLSSTGKVTGLAIGEATVRASLAVNNNAYHDITIHVIDPNTCQQEVVATDFEDGYLFSSQLAVDLEVVNDQFIITSVETGVVKYASTFKYRFFKDDNGFPGEEVASSEGTITDHYAKKYLPEYDGLWTHHYIVELITPVKLTKGKYWMQVESDALAWETTTASIGGLPLAFNNGNGWNYSSYNSEFLYKIKGLCETGDLSVLDSTMSNFEFYPNPVKNELNIASETLVKDVEVFDLTGRTVLKTVVNKTNAKVNVNNLSAGVYIVKANLENGETKTFKVIKK